MKTNHAVLAGTVLIALGLAYSALLYPHLPERIPIHWGLDGRVDGWGEKSWAAWLTPLITALLAAGLFALPALSPQGFSMEGFRETFHYVVVVVTAMMIYMHVVMLQAALRPDMDVARALISGTFLFLAVIGNVMGKARRNFWFGVRTPWTLASERVWIGSNRLAAHLMVAAGLIGAAAVWLGAPPLACFSGLLPAALIPVVHSLLFYKQLEREGRLDPDE